MTYPAVRAEQQNIVPNVKVGQRAQVVIPVGIRRDLGIEEGDVLQLTVDQHGRIVLERVPDDPIDRLVVAGHAAHGNGADALAQQDELRGEWDR